MVPGQSNLQIVRSSLVVDALFPYKFNMEQLRYNFRLNINHTIVVRCNNNHFVVLTIHFIAPYLDHNQPTWLPSVIMTTICGHPFPIKDRVYPLSIYVEKGLQAHLICF